ncbi:glycosyltransferase [Candidatus Albibeggiatoa sp. nov. NOAA]|uniref:glycosyltransferase n=1 Tax=Candidatus Albibeggiatoa sp. nov. NOAA TaxID=3162724 RepID=UPI0032F6AFDA|nr:glycosyltransferase [Thiotrichaceae bacterium]
MLKLSVVIIGRNEGERLVRCIRSVQAMSDFNSDHIEIIYVDSDSTDDSPQQAKQLGAKVLTVHPERPAAAIGRNAGWQAAQAPYILFLDGDTILNPDFVSVALQQFEAHPKTAIVWGHRRELYPDKSLYQGVLDLDWVYPAGLSEFCGGDAVMRRDVLAEVNGYNPQLIAGEEPEMCQRIRAKGYEILHIDQAMTLHDLAITKWSQYWRRATRAGHAYAEVSNLLKNTDTPLWERDAKRNLIHSTVLISVALLGVMGSVVLSSIWPLLFSLGFFAAISIRTAWKCRWKCIDPLSLFFYGVHSHFQQIPITVGQLSYYYLRWQGKRRGLIEYK